ncbi:MAG: conjugal transfer protein TraF [Nitrospira sp.]|nr:conjugal transfer protein TraF [Nitrospira sp.]
MTERTLDRPTSNESRTYAFAQLFPCLILFLLAGEPTAGALAAEFVFVGPRATGMGGAGVAVTTDALASYWNPAGLAMTQTVDVRVQGSGLALDRKGFGDAIRDLEDFSSADPAAAAKARDIAARLNQPGSTLSIAGSAGFYLKGHLGGHAIGISVSDVATGGGYISRPVDPVTLRGRLALRGLEARQLAFSYGYAFSDKTFAVGITAKVIQGAAYAGFVELEGGSGVTISNRFGKPTISTTYGIDVGAVYRPSSWIRFGIVAKDLNTPTFDDARGGEVKLDPQVRGGMALNPWSTLTLTADIDLTANKTLLPGVKSRILSLGAEQTFLTEFLSLRIGTFKNLEDANTPFIPTAGLGLRVFFLRADAGGGYDFREQGVLVSASISATF